MKITCVSDLHGFFPELPGGDLLILGGDYTASDTDTEHCDFCDWLENQDYRYKVVIAGNHDGVIEEDGCLCIGDYDGINVKYLCDSCTTFEGLKIWGSPWTSTFEGMNPRCKAFTVGTQDELAEKFKTIPSDVDILITHSPPYMVLDWVRGYKGLQHVGSQYLWGALTYCFRPKLWVFGHVHEGYGVHAYKCVYDPNSIKQNIDDAGTLCINASYVTKNYEPINKPITIEI